MENIDLLSWASSQTISRDAALAIVANHSEEWLDLAMIEMAEFARQSKYHTDYPQGFTNSHVRAWLVPLIGQPNHHNCWGSFIMKCIKAGIIEDTGTISRLGANARKQSVYRFVIPIKDR